WRSAVLPSEMVTVDQARAWGGNVIWVDARPDEEFARDHVPGAISLNEDRWNDLLSQFLVVWSPGKKVVVYCSSLSCNASRELAPVQFASDIDNYKILPWPFSVALAFYLPWLEIFCGFALVARTLYRGALSILTTLILVFTLATTAAKVRGLDITCGCFGHASQNWSFPTHLATNLGILAALLVLWLSNRSAKPS